MRRCFLFLAPFTLIAGIVFVHGKPRKQRPKSAWRRSDQVARPMAGVTVAVHNDATGADLDPVKNG